MRARGKYIAAAAATLMGTVLVAAPASAVSTAGCQWTSAVLPVPGGYSLEDLGGGDGAGAVAGTLRPAKAGDPLVGVVWRANRATVLGTAFGQNTELSDVNAAGVAVGSYADPHVFGVPDLHHAIRYTGGRFERLPEPPGFANTTAMAINTRGDIMGAVGETANNGLYRTVLRPADAPGTVEVLPAPRDFFQSPGGLDEDGTVAAGILGGAPSGGFEGYLWPRGGPAVQLASPVPAGDVVPTAIAGGRVAGYAGDAGAFLWHLDGSVDRALPGVRHVWAMNPAGDIAGSADDGSTLFLPAGGGPAQTLVPGGTGQEGWVRDVAGNGDVVGTVTTQSPEYRRDVVRWHCG
ncbi:hypothetical protein M8542_16685 [Amycolatopsis sp. OK19-0408]|uniref:HAF family extracellular repeat protein n=1 Tax=Amycolatopsis iheyensis TaxID=2945988 RepID=A0A9X2SJ65_9PSEU|nr:hypothetical protein [Amycolatopsis iheyensis]MCR6484462.1 hypothetical protein [Amycolatopsis iheyensis]